MSRHLKTVTDAEWEDLQDRLLAWLEQTDISGSRVSEYNLYRALDEEREKVQGAVELVAAPVGGDVRRRHLVHLCERCGVAGPVVGTVSTEDLPWMCAGCAAELRGAVRPASRRKWS